MPLDKRKIPACSLLILGIVVVFGQTLGFDFVNYDDGAYVYENHYVMQGLTWAGIKWAFTSTQNANWNPIVAIVHMVNSELFGLNPHGHHFVNLFFHTINTLLLFFLLEWLTGALYRSAFVAAFFAIHPLHVEPVVWISSLKDVLSTFLWLVTFLVYSVWTKKPGKPKYYIVMALYSLGLMAKPMLVTLPATLLLLDFWPLQRISLQEKDGGLIAVVRKVRKLVLEKVPLFGLAFLSTIVTYIGQKSGGAVRALDEIPLAARLGNAILSYIKYLFFTVWPYPLLPFYQFDHSKLTAVPVFGALLLLVAASLFFVRLGKRLSFVTFGWLWYLVTLLPVIGIVPLGDHAMADRYTYVPLIGIFIMVVWGGFEIASEEQQRQKALFIAGICLLLVIVPVSYRQVGYWRNGISLFEYSVKASPPNGRVFNNLGMAYLDAKKYQDAYTYFEKAVELEPNHSNALSNYGTMLAMKGNVEQGKQYVEKAIALEPNRASYYNNLGIIMANTGDVTSAIANFSKAISIDPNYKKAKINLDKARKASGKNQQKKP